MRTSRSLETYRDYIAGSRGEWSAAKNGYVATNSGWFSERSANYLAAGRPVVMQSTGFERWLPTGEGVLSFAALGEAVAAIDAVNADYELHSKAAREIALEYFDAKKVLTRFLEEVV